MYDFGRKIIMRNRYFLKYQNSSFDRYSRVTQCYFISLTISVKEKISFSKKEIDYFQKKHLCKRIKSLITGLLYIKWDKVFYICHHVR